MSYVADVSHTEEFDVPASAVWQLLIDWAAIVDWMPGGFIASLRMQGQGIGAIRHLVTGKGVAMSERLDAVDEAAGTLDLSLVGPLPWGLLSYRARGQILSTSPESCRLTWRGTFETPESGEQAGRVAHLLGKSYANMFQGVRSESARRHRQSLQVGVPRLKKKTHRPARPAASARARVKRAAKAAAPQGEDLARLRISVTTIGDLLLTAADRYPDTLALVFPDAQYTYRELAARALSRARSLRALGVRPHDHVGILMHTCPAFVEIFFGAALCGAVIVPINARYRSMELNYVIENGDIATLVTTDAIAEHVSFIERLDAALPELKQQTDARQLRIARVPRLRNIAVLGRSRPAGFIPQREFDAAARTVAESDVHVARLGVRVRDVALMLYTSGTTANPKGCLITHEAQVRNSIALGRHRYRLTHADRFWSPLPMFHIAAVLPMLAIFDVGGTYLTMDHFDPGVALKMLERHKVTATYPCFVTIMQGLIYHPDFPRTNLKRIRLMNSNFAVQPPAVAEAIMRAMPQALQVGSFGMTEAAGTVCTGSPGEPETSRITRLGRPLPGLEVRIVEPETGRELPSGERGEVLVRGYCLLEGYYKDAEKTAQALDRDGWFHTGDVGSLDARGTIMFHGRYKDMLKVGGENVAAAEIEAFIGRHPSVKLAQVVGIPDQKYVEVPAAFVELKPGAKLSEQEVIAFCKGEVAAFKVPRVVRFVSEWPMSSSKVQKFRLRQALVEELGLG